MKNRPIVLVEDDSDDQELITSALKLLEVPNEIKIFENGQKALDYLKVPDTEPFLIISDVNLPVMNGLQLKAEIQKTECLRVKSIPFIILSTSAEKKGIFEAYKLSIQGFFVKENTFEGIKNQLKLIIDYWGNCKHPSYKLS